jgi:hypothetical protein
VRFGKYSSPAECLFVAKLVLLLRGLGLMDVIYDFLSVHIYNIVTEDIAINISINFWQGLFWLSILYSFITAFQLHNKFYSTRNGLILCLLCISVPAIVMGTTSKLDIPLPSTYSILCEGLVTSLLTSDIIIAKMANRQLHPLVPAMFLFSLLGDSYGLFVVAFYYICILSELCYCFDVSLFSTHDERTIVFVGTLSPMYLCSKLITISLIIY